MQKTPTHLSNVPPTPEPTTTQKVIGMLIGALVVAVVSLLGLAACGLAGKIVYSVFMLGWNLI